MTPAPFVDDSITTIGLLDQFLEDVSHVTRQPSSDLTLMPVKSNHTIDSEMKKDVITLCTTANNNNNDRRSQQSSSQLAAGNSSPLPTTAAKTSEPTTKGEEERKYLTLEDNMRLK